ncbi:class I SAM-dependent methyltransferase [Paenibacillus ginsengarvi]|uniref:class I SAM-dependent methyltransferase n=1 Tax=Paenibacillus ginsengarvi TaxID=400777 RepID=UPI0023D95622|nr:class I SAM-dependent methyltransferase [Paenibacillus ginsengarvi]
MNWKKKDEQTYNRIIQKTKAYLNVSNTVMDYGCGTGLIAIELAEHVKAIHAIDTSSSMIEMADKKAKERNIANITCAHTAIMDTRYEAGSFDVILAFHVLHLLEDEHTALHRINELLKPGGLLISATPCMGEKKALSILLSLAGRVGLVPNIKSFQIRSLIDTMEKGDFSIVESVCLNESSQEYFIVARKIE